MGVFLYRLFVSNAFGGRAGFDVDASYIFPQSVLAAVTLVGGEAGRRVGRAGAECEVGFSPCSVAVTTQLWVGSHPKLLEQKL